jgi:hypothetical protein
MSKSGIWFQQQKRNVLTALSSFLDERLAILPIIWHQNYDNGITSHFQVGLRVAE